LAAGVWDTLVEAGAAPVGLGARDTLRLEAGNCLYGHELDETISPLEAGLGWVVKLNKPGGFLGSEAIAARAARPGHRRLVGLALDGKRIPREGMAVLQEDSAIGRVTSGTFGPSVQRGIALALVEAGPLSPGTSLNVDLRGRVLPAEVVKPPFYRRSQEKS
jgi:aminomethyltransferase